MPSASCFSFSRAREARVSVLLRRTGGWIQHIGTAEDVQGPAHGIQPHVPQCCWMLAVVCRLRIRLEHIDPGPAKVTLRNFTGRRRAGGWKERDWSHENTGVIGWYQLARS
jgi:hypothetical protein